MNKITNYNQKIKNLFNILPKQVILAGLIMLNSFCLINAQLSEDAEISIITSSPGDELYSTFGHTAIRVNDVENEIDIVFNYGTFDFKTKHFYLKFARGQLNYFLSIEPFDSFVIKYGEDDRAVWEQVLDLTFEEKNRLFTALVTNAQPENREYKYHFFFDNCATRIVDIIVDNLDNSLIFIKPEYLEAMTFRTAIESYLEKSLWIKFGLDLLLGAPTDNLVNEKSIQFLPDYLMDQFSTAKREYGKFPIVRTTNTILKSHRHEGKTKFSPFIILSIICLLVFFISIYDFKRNKCSKWLDYIVFTIPGLLGLLIVFLWFFTLHTVTGPNLNLIWATPLLIIFVFLNKYNLFYKIFAAFLITSQIGCLLFFTQFNQYIPLALIPVWIMLIVRIFLKFSEVRHIFVKKKQFKH